MKQLLAALFLLFSTLASAQPFPSKPVKMVIPWPPGGGNDILGRLLADALGGPLGQTVVVDNRGGANGLIGAEAVAKSAPDGYTIMFHSVTTHLINATFYSKVAYDTLGDFVGVSLIGEAGHVLVENPAFPAKSIKELVAMAAAQPGKISYASFGAGSSSHLSGELFDSMLGIKLVHIPYKGSGPAMTDTMAGHVPLFFSTIAGALPSIKSGKVRPLAVTTGVRSKLLPDVPTVDEAAGVRGYETSVMYGVWAPAKTPDAVVARLNGEIVKLLRDPAFAKKMEEHGLDSLSPGTPGEMDGYLKAQLPKWAKMVKESGARGD
jgi:tripartite-type tricarboxylate transporter receptor subunit TctC